MSDDLFVEETKLEESGVSLRLIGIMLLVVAVGASAAWYLIKQQKDLTAQDATPVLASVLKAQSPASVHFHVGNVASSVDEKPRDPHYKLLQKAGLISWNDDKKGGAVVKLTPAGETVFAALPEFSKEPNKDGTQAYTVPLARRELVAVTGVKMLSANVASVEYSWKWVPNEVGQKFDVSNKLVKEFNTWERQNLINNYGVNFYNDTQKSSVKLMRAGKSWKIYDGE